MTAQTIIVLLVVLGAAAYIGRRAWRTVRAARGGDDAGCGAGCGCDPGGPKTG